MIRFTITQFERRDDNELVPVAEMGYKSRKSADKAFMVCMGFTDNFHYRYFMTNINGEIVRDSWYE